MSGFIDWFGQHQELLTNVLVGLMALAAAFGLGVSANELAHERSTEDGQD